jgi:hypothetical protein
LLKAPVVVSVHAKSFWFRYYKKGIFTDFDGFRVCGERPNHSVLAIGYGYDKEKNLDYAILKNSWGTSWGEDGYMRISLAVTPTRPFGMCGIFS